MGILGPPYCATVLYTSTEVSVLLSASVERCFVSRMRDFFRSVPHKEQAFSAFNAPSQRYQLLQAPDIQIPDFSPDTIPVYTLAQNNQFIDTIKTNKATIPGDIPAKVFKRYSKYFCVPLADIINASIQTGVWPDRYKKEIITPIAKVSPTETLSQVRPISNLPLCDKIFESIISHLVIKDMKLKMDLKQYGNLKGLGIQH